MSFIKLILNKINLTQRIETLKFHSSFERRLHNYPILKQFNGAQCLHMLRCTFVSRKIEAVYMLPVAIKYN